MSCLSVRLRVSFPPGMGVGVQAAPLSRIDVRVGEEGETADSGQRKERGAIQGDPSLCLGPPPAIVSASFGLALSPRAG